MEKKEYERIAKARAEKFFGGKIASIRYLGGGTFGRVFLCRAEQEPRALVVKLYLAKDLAKNEAADLELLAASGAVRVPKVYFAETGDLDCVGMEYIKGKNAFTYLPFLFRSKRQKAAFCDAVIDRVVALHERTNDKYGYARGPEYDTWRDFYLAYAEDIMATARRKREEGAFEENVLRAGEEALVVLREILGGEPACLSHGDCNVMNIMADKKTFLPIAFIDPLNALYGDPEYDLYQLGALTGNCYGLVKRYLERVPTGETTPLKVASYGVIHEIKCYESVGKYTGFIMRGAIRALKRAKKAYAKKKEQK